MGFCSYSREFSLSSYTSIENQFIDKYMASADGDAVKVYIFGLYLCQNVQGDYTLAEASRALNMPEARRRAMSVSLRPKPRTSLRCRKMDMSPSRSTASVVTLKPPPVEPGAAPTSMSSMVNSLPSGLRAARSTLLKPAVRGLTAWNMDASAASELDIFQLSL